jgi:cold shock protein
VLDALRRGVLLLLERAHDVGLFFEFEKKETHQMPNGTIKKLVSDRGFGFIAGDDGKEYFFHRDGVDNFDFLRGGETVTFNVEASPKGPRASQVKVSR